MPATGISRGGSHWETLQLDSVGIAISGLEKTWPDPLELHENILFWIVLKITTFFVSSKRIKSGGSHGVGEAGLLACLLLVSFATVWRLQGSVWIWHSPISRRTAFDSLDAHMAMQQATIAYSFDVSSQDSQNLQEEWQQARVYIQEYKGREVDCEVCGSKVRKCNWFRYLGTAKHRDGVETGGGGRDIGGQGKGGRGEKLKCTPWIETTPTYVDVNTYSRLN